MSRVYIPHRLVILQGPNGPYHTYLPEAIFDNPMNPLPHPSPQTLLTREFITTQVEQLGIKISECDKNPEHPNLFELPGFPKVHTITLNQVLQTAYHHQYAVRLDSIAGYQDYMIHFPRFIRGLREKGEFFIPAINCGYKNLSYIYFHKINLEQFYSGLKVAIQDRLMVLNHDNYDYPPVYSTYLVDIRFLEEYFNHPQDHPLSELLEHSHHFYGEVFTNDLVVKSMKGFDPNLG